MRYTLKFSYQKRQLNLYTCIATIFTLYLPDYGKAKWRVTLLILDELTHIHT